ncbi:hypothetical protein [Marinitoga lauensis]|uniref:hypothetical protein n=1 Tax=Marinitoga lauensis TaxID=2201189 RepID=UPI001012FA8D|nr:hypothetical protein [Marinitoga lauensis]
MKIKKMLFSSNKKQILKALEIILNENKEEYTLDLFKLLKNENDIFIQESIIHTLKHLNLDNIDDDLFFEFFKEENLLRKEFMLSLLSSSKK